MSNDNWKEVEGISDIHDFEKGSLVGVYVGAETGVGSNGSTIYHFENEAGKEESLWESALIKSRLSKVQIGQKVKIDFLGKKESPKTGREYKDYKVFVAES